MGLCLLNIADQDVSWLVEQPQEIFFESPAFSPDGQFIAYISCSTTDSTMELVVFDVKKNLLKLFLQVNFKLKRNTGIWLNTLASIYAGRRTETSYFLIFRRKVNLATST